MKELFQIHLIQQITLASMLRQQNGWQHQKIVHFGIDSMRPGPIGDR